MSVHAACATFFFPTWPHSRPLSKADIRKRSFCRMNPNVGDRLLGQKPPFCPVQGSPFFFPDGSSSLLSPSGKRRRIFPLLLLHRPMASTPVLAAREEKWPLPSGPRAFSLSRPPGEDRCPLPSDSHLFSGAVPFKLRKQGASVDRVPSSPLDFSSSFFPIDTAHLLSYYHFPPKKLWV